MIIVLEMDSPGSN